MDGNFPTAIDFSLFLRRRGALGVLKDFKDWTEVFLTGSKRYTGSSKEPKYELRKTVLSWEHHSHLRVLFFLIHRRGESFARASYPGVL